MVILTGFYNAEQYIERCISSIMGQSFTDFKCYITHDLSTDNSVKLIKEMIEGDDRFILIDDNEKKLYQTGNFDKVIRNNPNISDNEVLVEVDGDDYLPDGDVLKRIDGLYKDQNIPAAKSNARPALLNTKLNKGFNIDNKKAEAILTPVNRPLKPVTIPDTIFPGKSNNI